MLNMPVLYSPAIREGVRVLYSTVLDPRVYGRVIERARNRSWWVVEREDGDRDLIHKTDVIAIL